MAMDPLHYKKLLQLYLDNKCSPAELKELFAFLKEKESNRVLLEQMRDEFDNVFDEASEKNTEIPLTVSKDMELAVIPFYKKRWISRVAAAAVLIIIGAAAYFIISDKNQNQKVIAVEKAIPANTIAPGGNKAILTLGNGQKVILDSAENGTIALQGNSRITKNDKGEIVYDATAPTNNFSEILFNTVSTPNGGQYKVVLPDGTNVWLNAASSIRFPTKFVDKERAVAITGEAYFEVTKNASMPFKVKINGAEEIEVLGTHFNVMAYKGEKYTKATLLEGLIKIHNRDESIFVKPGGQAILQNDGEIELVHSVNTDHIIAWKNGLFDFDNDDLPYIMRQLSRWYDVDIVYNDKIPEGHYAGSIRKQSNITEVLKMLELAGDVQFSIIGKKILVKGN
jgi:ferric-dicitrate binding protein FerR (iron transport regulator)